MGGVNFSRKETIVMRICSECKQNMTQGYMIGDGDEYYCCDKCLFKHYTPKEWREIYESENGYWTEWNEEE